MIRCVLFDLDGTLVHFDYDDFLYSLKAEFKKFNERNFSFGRYCFGIFGNDDITNFRVNKNKFKSSLSSSRLLFLHGQH